MPAGSGWSIAGSYYESCNCPAVCPCRRLNGKPGGDSVYGLCQFMLSWSIKEGHAEGVDLSGCRVVMAGFYQDSDAGRPWTVKLFVDAEASPQQSRQLERIFLGKAGGNIAFTSNIATIVDTEPAAIELVHEPGREAIRLGGLGSSSVVRRAAYEGTISCGIPGHDHPGTEYVAGLSMHDGPFQWDYQERCGFATDFHHFA
jgi:hypothetical protein